MGTMQHPAVRKRYRGTLKLYSEPRYFGFIEAIEDLPGIDGKSIFVHRLNFIARVPSHLIVPGAEVEFEIGPPYAVGKKPQAVRVKILEQHAGLSALAKVSGGAA